MNLLAARIALRPRTLTDVLDLAVPFCVAQRRLIGKLALVTLVPLAGLAAYLRLARGTGWGLIWLVLLPLSFLVQGVFTVAFADALFDEPGAVRARRVLGQFARRLLPFLFAHLARLIAIALAVAVVVMIPFLASLLFVSESVLLERVPIWPAFTRSRALARYRGFFCFGLWTFTLLVPVIAALAGELVGYSIVTFTLQLGAPAGELFSDGGSGFAVLGVLAAVPVVAAARFLGYIDLRTRKEGWDIQLRFSALAEQDEAARREAA
jgi:hypothetical protein